MSKPHVCNGYLSLYVFLPIWANLWCNIVHACFFPLLHVTHQIIISAKKTLKYLSLSLSLVVILYSEQMLLFAYQQHHQQVKSNHILTSQQKSEPTNVEYFVILFLFFKKWHKKITGNKTATLTSHQQEQNETDLLFKKPFFTWQIFCEIV